MRIFTFFFAVLVANFEFAGFAPKQKYMAWRVFMKRSVLQNPDREGTNQSARIRLRLALPYMRFILIYLLAKTFCSEGKIKRKCREKTVYIKTHKTAINRPVDHTGET